MHVSDISQMTSSPKEMADVGCTSCVDLRGVSKPGLQGVLEDLGITPTVQRVAVIAAVAGAIWCVVK